MKVMILTTDKGKKMIILMVDFQPFRTSLFMMGEN